MMKTWKPSMLALLGMVLCAGGCSGAPLEQPRRQTTGDRSAHPVVCPVLAEVPPQQVVVILRAGGTQSEDDLVGLVRYLAPATHIYVAEAAPSGSGVVVADALPPAPAPFECVVKNQFDPREKQACQRRQRLSEAQRDCLEAARQRIITALRGLTPARAPLTEGWGVLGTAAQILAAYATSTRWLVMYGDLGDNGPLRGPHALPGLEGVKVLVRLAHPTPDQTAPRLAGFTQPLRRWGALVTVVPVEVPWPVAVAMPPSTAGGDGPVTALAALMVTLEPGPYGVIVASHATEQAARAEVDQIKARYPELRPWYWRPPDGKYWAVCLGEAYTRASAETLKHKAIELGLRPDTFLVARRQ